MSQDPQSHNWPDVQDAPTDTSSIYADEEPRAPAPLVSRDSAQAPEAVAQEEFRRPVAVGTVVAGLVIAVLAVLSMLRFAFEVTLDAMQVAAAMGVGFGLLLMVWTGASLARRRRP